MKMRWELTIYGPQESVTMTIEAQDAEEARMKARREKEARKALTYELKKLD